jgi:hypothetical protein
MQKLTAAELMKLEDYAEQRPAFRKRVLEHKKHRKLHLGAHLTLLFEDRLTIQYQVQEMLRIERIFERGAIEEELGAYNPLIPDGRNWKATCLIEFEDPVERAWRLAQLKGIEDLIWAQAGEGARIAASGQVRRHLALGRESPVLQPERRGAGAGAPRPGGGPRLAILF